MNTLQYPINLSLLPSLRVLFVTFLIKMWPETFVWAALCELARPKRMLACVRLSWTYNAMKRAYRNKEYKRMGELAESCLQILPYTGSHLAQQRANLHCHHFAGLSCCLQSDWEAAADHLVRSGNIEGTPCFRCSVPPLSVARKLLGQGKTQAVLVYLHDLQRWWVCGSPLDDQVCKARWDALSKWIEEVRLNQVPRDYPWLPGQSL